MEKKQIQFSQEDIKDQYIEFSPQGNYFIHYNDARLDSSQSLKTFYFSVHFINDLRQNIGKMIDKLGIPNMYGKEVFREICQMIFYNN